MKKLTSLLLFLAFYCGLTAQTITPEQLQSIREGLFAIGENADELVTFDERSRGSWASVYQSTAPSVVLIRVGNGYGSGFIIEGGDIITNHHVVDGAETNAAGFYVVQVELGEIEDAGLMELSPDRIEGIVYASEESSDLALVRIQDDAIRARLASRALRIADGVAMPGQDVALIGNGALGFRWAIKVGAVSAVNRQDRIRLYEDQIRQLTEANVPGFGKAPKPRQDEMLEEARNELMGQSANMLLIESTASCVGGDSGGPLLNEAGEVVGVCHASITDGEQVTERYYYIHQNEVSEFLDNLPAQPLQERIANPDGDKGMGGAPYGKDPGGDISGGKPSTGGGFGADGRYYPEGAPNSGGKLKSTEDETTTSEE